MAERKASELRKINLTRSLMFIKIEIELLRQALVLLVHLHTDQAYLALHAVIEPAVVEHKLHVFHELLNALVLVVLQLALNRREVHRVLHYGEVVKNS